MKDRLRSDVHSFISSFLSISLIVWTWKSRFRCVLIKLTNNSAFLLLLLFRSSSHDLHTCYQFPNQLPIMPALQPSICFACLFVHEFSLFWGGFASLLLSFLNLFSFSNYLPVDNFFFPELWPSKPILNPTGWLHRYCETNPFIVAKVRKGNLTQKSVLTRVLSIDSYSKHQNLTFI